MTREELQEEIRRANLVLVGIGEQILGDTEGFYQSLAALLDKKDYYIVTLLDREGLEKAGLDPRRITAPLEQEEAKESWEDYLHWLSYTLNQKLFLLELGVGFQYPQVIRFPFEKTCYFNQKSRYLRVNGRFPQLSQEIADRGEGLGVDPVDFLNSF